MRRASCCLAVLGLAVLALALPGAASATPTVTFKAKAVPIPGFPHTGNIFGAGAAVEAEYNISGTEYGGFPPPLTHVNFYLPAGPVHPSGFPTCAPEVLEPTAKARAAAPERPAAPEGTVRGSSRSAPKSCPRRRRSNRSTPPGRMTFFTFGHSPVLLEILSKAHYVNSDPRPLQQEARSRSAAGRNGARCADASVKSIKVKAGSAIKKGGKTIYYGTLPTSCPKKYLPVKTELTFAGLGGLKEETVTAEYKAPCPRKK